MKRFFRIGKKKQKHVVRRKSDDPEDTIGYQNAIEAFRQAAPVGPDDGRQPQINTTTVVDSNNNKDDYENISNELPLAEHGPRRQTLYEQQKQQSSTSSIGSRNQNNLLPKVELSSDKESIEKSDNIINNNGLEVIPSGDSSSAAVAAAPAVATASGLQRYEPPMLHGQTFSSHSSSNIDQQQQQHQQQQYPSTNTPYYYYYNNGFVDYENGTGGLEPTMVDATYEEWYGDGYIGSPIKYIYPSGYQSMRPRGGPWKLSIFICLLFTWLSIFIVGHCSDRYSYEVNNNNNNGNNNYYNNNNNDNDVIYDDDVFVIETRWCGSRMLYFMWVMSMMITGLSASYCSIIGYIKVRDFAVANCRSQPPGMVGKSDYYVNISNSSLQGQNQQNQNHHQVMPSSPVNSNCTIGTTTSSHSIATTTYQKSIYQSDGTPQFWGGHIYRPTQAAVAVTSR